MNEVKKPKKPMIYYYIIVVLALLLFNVFVTPWIMERQVEEVDYGTFISMTEKKQISRVDIHLRTRMKMFIKRRK